ncbi:MAG: heparinase II/III family protein [Planctomycetota bacterium]
MSEAATPHPLVALFEAQCAAARAVGDAAVGPLLTEADRAVRGLLRLPGSGGEPFDVNGPSGLPDWRLDPFDYSETMGMLNRMSHWNTLLRAWRLSGRAAYVERVEAELADWIERCPCPMPPGEELGGFDYRGPTPWRLLETGIRMFESWVPSVLVLRRAGRLDDALYGSALRVCEQHARVLAVCTPVDSRPVSHNHMLMEMLGLLYVALAWPAAAEAAAYVDLAQAELCRAVDDQVTPEGAHVEGCPMYHNTSLRLFAQASAVLRLYGVEPAGKLDAAVRAMAGYSIQATRPSGKTVPWGDSDATGSTWTAARWAFAATGDASLFRQMRRLAGLAEGERLLREGVFDVPLEDPAALRAALDDPQEPPEPPCFWTGPNIKQVSLRTGWAADAWHVFFGCHLPTFNTHAHGDPAGFELSALGATPLPDPGRLTYAETEDRRDLKSAKWHNTLTVNGKEPVPYVNTWAFGSQGNGALAGSYQDKHVMAAACVQDSFDPVTHRRLIVLSRAGGVDGGLVVVDWLEGLSTRDRPDLWFHCDADDTAWEPDDCGWSFSARGQAFTVSVDAAGAARLTGPERLTGKLSEVFDQARPSLRVRVGCEPVDAGSLLLVTRVAAGVGQDAGEASEVSAAFAADGVRLAWPAVLGGGGLMWSADTIASVD